MKRSWGLCTLSLISCAGLLHLPGEARAAINMELRPAETTVSVGQEVHLELYAVADGDAESFVGMDVILLWNPAHLLLEGALDNGPVDWFLFGFFDDSQLDGLNDSFDDGDAFFQVFSFSNVEAPPEGVLIGTFVFTARRAVELTKLTIPPERGQNTQSRVIGEFGAILTGTLGSASVTVLCVPASAAGAEEIVNDNGVLVPSTKNRYLSISTGDANNPNHGTQHAIRVTFFSMPPAYAHLEGMRLWVKVPSGTFNDSEFLSSRPTTGFGDAIPSDDRRFLRVAKLACGPPATWDDPAFFRDWTDLKSCRGGDNNATGCTTDADCPGGSCSNDPFVHVYHELIIPGGVYLVQVLDGRCSAADEDHYSDPFMSESSRFGDVVGTFSSELQLWTAPDDMLSVSADLLAAIDAFLGRPVAPIKPRVDLAGFESGAADGAVHVGDILVGVSAFLGVPFTNTAAAPDPNFSCP